MYDELVKRLRRCASYDPRFVIQDCEEAADAIEELRKAVLRLEDESGIYDELPMVYIYSTKWISVEERLPKEDETVMTWGKQGVILLDWLHDNQWCCFGEATYWMPLPEPPKECE